MSSLFDIICYLLFSPFIGYSLSDLPVKAKRSALNYSLPITVNKTGELTTMYDEAHNRAARLFFPELMHSRFDFHI